MSETHARYKIKGEFVYLPKRTKEEQKESRKSYMKKWVRENPDKVKDNLKRYQKNQIIDQANHKI